MFNKIRDLIKEFLCEHDDKIISVPIDFDPKRNNQFRQGIKPGMFKECKKCKRLKSIFEI